MARRTPPLVPHKTPLAPASAAHIKKLQLIIQSARQIAKAKRPDAQQESSQIVELIDTLGFINVQFEDGSKGAVRFVAGLEKHPDTGLDLYVAVDREAAEAVRASEFAYHKWRAEKDKASGDVLIKIQRTAETTTAARTIYQLLRPGEVRGRKYQVSIRADEDGARNALDLRMSKLSVKLSTHLEQSMAVDLSSHYAEIASVLAEGREGGDAP